MKVEVEVRVEMEVGVAVRVVWFGDKGRGGSQVEGSWGMSQIQYLV